MPRADGTAEKPKCEIRNIYKEWKASHAVRMVAVKADRLLVSAKGPEEGQERQVKMCIKDAARNKFVLTPVLALMADHPCHPLPSIKELAREKHGKHFGNILSMCFCQFVSVGDVAAGKV